MRAVHATEQAGQRPSTITAGAHAPGSARLAGVAFVAALAGAAAFAALNGVGRSGGSVRRGGEAGATSATPSSAMASPAPSGASTAPSPSPAETLATARPLFGRWRAITDQRERLVMPGEIGRRAARTAAERTGVAGRAASVFQWWIHLGEWLARTDGVFDPPARDGGTGSSQEFYSEGHFEMMWRAQGPDQRFAQGLAWTHDTPADGRAWVYLAESVEAAGGCDEEARRLYALGLNRRPRELKASDSLGIVGHALARAAIVTGGNIGHTCVDWLHEGTEDTSGAWYYFSMALDGTDLDKHRAVLLWLLDRPEWSIRAARGLVKTADRRLPGTARARWLDEASRMRPQSGVLAREVGLWRERAAHPGAAPSAGR
jgi:hypothetical protein